MNLIYESAAVAWDLRYVFLVAMLFMFGCALANMGYKAEIVEADDV